MTSFIVLFLVILILIGPLGSRLAYPPSRPDFIARIVAGHRYLERHSEGAIFSKKKGDRGISPRSGRTAVGEIVGARAGARFFTALRFVQHNIALFHERLPRILTGCLCVFIPTLACGQSSEKIHTTIGFPNQIYGHVIPGSAIEPKSMEDRDQPMIVRILDTYPHGSDLRYDIEFYALDPGAFNLSNYLQRIDATDNQPIPAIDVMIDPMLPAGQVEPSELVPKPTQFYSFYVPLMIVGSVIWFAGLAAILFYGRAKKIREQAAATPLTVAQRLRPLVDAAMAGKISTEQKAELERLLASFWAEKMHWNNLTATELRQRLRSHPESAELLEQIDEWLHRPQAESNSNEVDVAKLLAPYA